jgi:hypothetical protein
LSLEKCDLSKTFISGGFGGASPTEHQYFTVNAGCATAASSTLMAMRNISQRLVDVRFTPESGHWNSAA